MASFPASRAAALHQFNAFLPSAKRYDHERNFVRRGHANVTRLSPATRYRLVTETELATSALARHDYESIEKLLQEIYWRTYFKGNLELHPGVWRQWRDAVDAPAIDGLDRFTRKAIAQIETAQAEVDVINAFAQELIETGYLHNHARMWFAAYWIHVARLPWEHGAAFFYKHLLDGDAACNTLSWRWVAGLHTPGKAYLARASNILKCCERALIGEQYSLKVLDDSVVREHIPQEHANRTRHALLPLGATVRRSALPPNARVGLWLHSDDLSVEQVLKESDLPLVGALCAQPFTLAQDLQWSPLVQQHICAVLADAQERCTQALGVPVSSEHDRPLDVALAAFAKQHQLTHLVAMRPFVGELSDAASKVTSTLKDIGVECIWLRRAEDSLLFPAAGAGFFGFWQKASKSLRSNSAPQQGLLAL